jgi:hypothetical protein
MSLCDERQGTYLLLLSTRDSRFMKLSPITGRPIPEPASFPLNVRECLIRARRFYIDGDAPYARLAIVIAAQDQDVRIQQLAFAEWVRCAVFHGRKATTRDRKVTLAAFDLAIREAVE